MLDWREVEAQREAILKYNSFGLGSIGACYERGMGVEKNLETAAEYYKKAAEEGDSTA
jgi:TPR repeat protein